MSVQVENLEKNMAKPVSYTHLTHSPFIINSVDNAVIYDLEKNLLVENGLSDVPYACLLYTSGVSSDIVLKNYWIGNDKFADRFNAVLFGGSQIIRADELENEDTEDSVVLEHRKQAEGCLLYTSRCV